MWKKTFALFLAFSLIFVIAAPIVDTVDAKKYRSPSRSFTPTPPKNDTNTQAPQRSEQINSGTTTNNSGSVRQGGAAGTATQGSFGGNMMRGLLIGGMAGLLFGGLLANFGALGSILGLIVNLLAIFVLFIIARKVIQYFIHRRRQNDGKVQP